MNIGSYALLPKKKLNILQKRINELELQVNTATDFVKEIEKGNWNASDIYATGSNLSALTESLVSLCNQLKTYALQEKERNWVTEGLAKFIDILRSSNDNLHELTDKIISSLVKYMGVNQGALYIINDDNPNDVFIEMAACYAYNRKKHFEQRIKIGEGLTGQAVLEKDIIYMSDIPQGYVKITSGLGEALPTCILIVPLKIEEKVFGVVEVASFEHIPQYRIEFVQRLGESIAATLSNVKIAKKTQVLLQQSQVQAEMMRSQEEEMRQNMEELNATQEEMHRVLKSAQGKEKFLNEIINAPKDSIYILDKDCKLISYNKVFGDSLQQMLGVNDLKGFCLLDLFPNDVEKKKQRSYIDKALAGENLEYTTDYTSEGITSYYTTNYAPLRDENGKIYAVAAFSKDVTQLVEAQKRTEKLLNESTMQGEEMKAQEEEMRQNLEELSATQEEMHRVLKEFQEKERYMKELMNASNDGILTVDRDMHVINCNEAFKKTYSAHGLNIEKGFDLNNFFTTDEEKKKYAAIYERVFKGESFEIIETYETGDVPTKISIHYSPLRNEEGKIIAAAVFIHNMNG